jgi:rSAM/selenodomain-associated transferase 1
VLRTMSSAVMIFIRAYLKGKIKTRLAKTLGNEKAAEFYHLCTDAAISEVSRLSLEVVKYIFVAEMVSGSETDYLAHAGFNIDVQEGENLGQRLYNAFNRVFENGAQKAIVVASDVPDLTAGIIEEALSSLDKGDVVIGPCYDGGYYLIGMKRLHKRLFRDISWGTEQVFKQTLMAINKSGLTVSQLPILIDIDTEGDLMRWLEMNGNKKPALLDFVRAMNI